jgi:SAM-dependent methyltransferase
MVVAGPMSDSPKDPTPVYQAFWHEVGASFPDLEGATSTAHYRECEQRLLREFLPLKGTRLLKTDLWDEARNTRILQWAADQGADVIGIDISGPTVVEAKKAFGDRPLRATVADVRHIPLADASVTAVYSMGTVEHFDETDLALREIFRVLAPGGRAIIGVPNRLDPFLRPALVWLMQRAGWYHYGFEKSYTHARFAAMLRHAGFNIVAHSGLLFIPGWLRMADLLAHTRWRPLRRVTSPVVRWFAAVERRYPWVRRHGYLLAIVCERPEEDRDRNHAPTKPSSVTSMALAKAPNDGTAGAAIGGDVKKSASGVPLPSRSRITESPAPSLLVSASGTKN